MPTLAIFTYELRGLLASWLVRLWFVATALLAFFTVAGNWGRLESAPLIATLFFSYLVFPWFLVVIVLGISPITGSRLDSLADGILSRPVTRYEYLFASWTARVAVVWAVYPGGHGAFDGVGSVGQASGAGRWSDFLRYRSGAGCSRHRAQRFIVSLSFLAGTMLRKPLLAIVVLIFVWLPINVILSTFALEEFSPISLSRALPTLLRTPWNEAEAEPNADMAAEDLKALSRQADQFMSILSGKAPPRQSDESFFEKGDYHDFSLLRVSLGYAVPSLMALVLSAAFFCWRDL